MKIIGSVLVFAAASISNAAVLCTVTRENPQVANQYDQIVFNDVVGQETAVTLKNDGSVTSTGTFESIFAADQEAVANVPEAKRKFEEIYRDARFIFISVGADDVVTISFAHFDSASTENQIPADSHFSGSVGNHPVWVSSSRTHVSCARTPSPSDTKP